MKRWTAPLAMLFSFGLGLAGGCQHLYHLGNDGDGSGTGGTAPDLGSGIACDSLDCRIDRTCTNGGHTTLRGKVYAPNGTLPLYNAAVFVPSAPVASFPSGVTCDRCDGKISNALAATQTGPDGSFLLTDLPGGANVPRVIQLGRWRRQVTLPAITDCVENVITEPALTRLPRNRIEGEIPQIAIATGGADPFECLLLKMGLDATEITSPDDPHPGRIHFYLGTAVPGTNLAKPAPRASELYASLANLLRYDVVLLPCEGGAYDKSQVDGVPLASDPRALLGKYLDAGGRVFTTHYSYDWLTYTGSPFNKIAAPQRGDGQWPVGQPDDFNHTIAARLDVSFPKGAAFAEWLQFAGASSAQDQLDIEQGRHDVTGVDTAYAQPWATNNFSSVGSGPGVMHFTLNTPLDAPKDDLGVPAYCGRLVFSDFHVTANALQSTTLPFPAACAATPLTDQEKALVFMLFDLSSCVQQDTANPIL